ncbi:hypothetical protein CKM354_000083000 [Cercospora kikuchii]|uniref:Uncharacterized protein n=1 Tax=Cercospora kikuchii TaxID=84275 RepID=A0A9P3F853_9PEZI|nr:uncharacterized protein CKM354_000083000 [Cercospora kikuchii]GIZ37383.1 hypothetical protein CKM354_000083000 [Cercospora kikuchii]
MTATSSVHPPASSNAAKTPIKLKVAMAQTVAADEQLLELQTKLKRAETSARYAKAQYNAACEASNARLEEANKQRGVLFDLLKNQVQGSALWDVKIAKQLAENRSQIAAGLVITSRSKLEDLERERDAAKQALDEYTRDSRSFRLAREARARREAAEQRQRELRAKETSPAPRTSPIKSPAAEKQQRDFRAKEASPSARTSPVRQSSVEEPKRNVTPGSSQQQFYDFLVRHCQPKTPQDERPSPDTFDRKPPTPVRSHPKRAPLPALPPKSQAEIYRDWHEQTKLAFSDYSTLTTFPAPPPPQSPCRKIPCATSTSRCQLGVCVDDVEKAFKTLDLPSMKEERARWHPDRFVRCVEKEKMQAMAKEVFQVVDAMYRKERETRSV